MQRHQKRNLCKEEGIYVIYCWCGFPLALWPSPFTFWTLILDTEMNTSSFSKISQLRYKRLGNYLKIHQAAAMSWLIFICSMWLISSGYFNGAEDCNYSPVKVIVALTRLITVEKEEWGGGVDRCCLSVSSVNDAFVALWEELSSCKEKSL